MPRSATLEAALQSHHEALISQVEPWPRQRRCRIGSTPPMPSTIDAFLRLVETGWDLEARRRPHGQRTTVVVHLDVAQQLAALHLGPLLPDSERRFLTCDATCEVWFERDGQVIGHGRSTRTIGRPAPRARAPRPHLRQVPGCAATRGLHAHHIRHWEDGGATDMDNLVLSVPTTTACTTAASSPSPDPPTTNS